MKMQIRVKSGSKKGPLVQTKENGEIIVFVKEQAIDGKANKAVIKALSSHYKVPKSQIEILGGHKSKHKMIEINQ